jgi:hypothetical protein
LLVVPLFAMLIIILPSKIEIDQQVFGLKITQISGYKELLSIANLILLVMLSKSFLTLFCSVPYGQRLPIDFSTSKEIENFLQEKKDDSLEALLKSQQLVSEHRLGSVRRLETARFIIINVLLSPYWLSAYSVYA